MSGKEISAYLCGLGDARERAFEAYMGTRDGLFEARQAREYGRIETPFWRLFLAGFNAGVKEVFRNVQEVCVSPDNSEIPTSVQNITPECRRNRTSFGAFDEAVSRLRQSYTAYHDTSDNADVTWRLSLVRVEPERP